MYMRLTDHVEQGGAATLIACSTLFYVYVVALAERTKRPTGHLHCREKLHAQNCDKGRGFLLDTLFAQYECYCDALLPTGHYYHPPT